MSQNREKLIEAIMDSLGEAKKSLQGGFGEAGSGFGMPHFMLMRKLIDQPDGLSISELAEASHVTSGAVSQFSELLVERGLIERVEDPKDRRIVRLKLTAKAKAKVKQKSELHRQRLGGLFTNLSDTELAQLAELVKKLRFDNLAPTAGGKGFWRGKFGAK